MTRKLSQVIKRVFRRKKLSKIVDKSRTITYKCSEFINFVNIGEGSFKVNRENDDNFYALKPFSESEVGIIINFVNENSDVNSHINILRFYGITKLIEPDVFKSDISYLVLDHADNGTLNYYLNKNFSELDWNNKLKLALQLTSVISFLHNNNITHNRLHADNIYVHQRIIKLDFFALKEISDKSVSLTTSKTMNLFSMIPYMDPKCFFNDNYKPDKKSDVYGIGMLLWQISSGRQPFHGDCNPNLALAILNGERETIVDGTPVEYSKLFTECWSYDPDERPNINEVVSILESIKIVSIPSIKLSNDQNNNTDQAAKWIEDSLKDGTVKFIPFNELENPTPLDEGGFGFIVKVTWKGNYAVYKKLTNKVAIGEQNMLDAFIRELRIHLHLGDYSDRIVHCFGISQDETTKYLLVMQYADGGDLQNYLENNFEELTWNDKKELASQIAEGLKYLHDKDIVHKDLHSKNIVIHGKKAKLTDFGTSKFHNQKSAIYMVNCGVIAYMEPNRIINPKFSYTKYSDIYSLGVIMWEISSGRPPFEDNVRKSEMYSLAFAISKEGRREDIIDGTPEEYERLYKICWDRDPAQRPPISKVVNKLRRMDFRHIDETKPVRVKVDKFVDYHDDLQLC